MDSESEFVEHTQTVENPILSGRLLVACALGVDRSVKYSDEIRTRRTGEAVDEVGVVEGGLLGIEMALNADGVSPFSDQQTFDRVRSTYVVDTPGREAALAKKGNAFLKKEIPQGASLLIVLSAQEARQFPAALALLNTMFGQRLFILPAHLLEYALTQGFQMQISTLQRAAVETQKFVEKIRAKLSER